MAEHSIQISVDASSGRAELRSLTQSIQSTSAALRQLGSAGGGNAFASLSRQFSSLSSSFGELKRQTSSDSGLSNLSREISMLSRGMPVAAREIVALASTLMVSRNAVALFGSALGSVALADFAKSVSSTGNSLLSFRIGIDAVAASSKESGDALTFIRDAATRIGAPLDSATDSFKALYVNMRSLGRPVEEIEKVFSGFQTAMTALHISARDQALSWREIAETYSQGVIHTRQAILSLGSHVPGMAANLAAALNVSGEKLHAMFKAGGLPLDTWTKVAALLEKQYGAQLPEAFQHSQQNIVALQNEFTKLKQVAFDSGFDSGLTALLKSTKSAIDSFGGADSIGRKIGEGFHIAFASADLLLTKLIQLKEPIVTIGGAILGWNVAVATIRLAAGAVALLFTPLGLAAAGAALLTSQWDSMKSVFSGSDADFNRGAEAIKRLTGGWIDLHGAIKGAIVAWEFGKDLLSGKGIDASRALATQAGAAFDAGTYGKQEGTSFADSFVQGASTLFSKLDDLAGKHLPGRDLAKSLRDEWSQIYKDSAPNAFHGGGDYSSNAARYAKPDLSLSEALTKTFDKLQPTIAALKEYKTQLDSIASMRGKLDPLGNVIGDETIKRLKEAARADAFESSFPTANLIQDRLEKLRADSDFLGKGGKESRAIENEIIKEKLALQKKGVDLSGEEESALRKIITLEKEIAKGGSDGFTQWATSQKSAVESLNDNIKSSMDSVADGIAKIATQGKGQFHSLGAAIRDELRSILSSTASNFLRSGIKSLMAEGIKGLDLGDMKKKLADAIDGGDKIVKGANDKLDKFDSDALKNVAEANINAGVVNLTASGINGIGGASGLDAFRPNGINANAVGGISNDNAALGGRDQIRSLGSIGSNSASDFGKLIDLQSKPHASGGDLQSKALSIATSMLDKHEITNRGEVNSFLKKGGVDIDAAQTKWCAAFVNSSLAQAGVKGDGSLTANAFKSWGKAANLDDVKAGDVLVQDNGHGLGPGGHVGFSTGRSREGARGREFERLSGNHSNRVETDWVRSDLIQARRATQRIDGRSLDNDDITRKSQPATIKLPSDDLSDAVKSAADKQKELSDDAAKKLKESTQKDKNLSGSDALGGLAQLGSVAAGDHKQIGQKLAAMGPGMLQKLLEKSGLLDKLGDGLGSLLGGLFSEGGYVGSPVSSASMPASFWAGAPHYAEGTPNTSGGHPAILHDNEAVIPLSRGREIPVELKGGAGGGDIHNHFNMATNIQSKDADSFRRSSGQIAADFHKMAGRFAARNN